MGFKNIERHGVTALAAMVGAAAGSVIAGPIGAALGSAIFGGIVAYAVEKEKEEN